MRGLIRQPLYDELDAASDGALSRAAKDAAFGFEKGKTVLVRAPAGLSNSAVLLIGAGKAADFKALDAENLGGSAVALALTLKEKAALFALERSFESDEVSTADFAARIGFGARLRAYRFDKYQTKVEAKDKPSLAKVTVYSAAGTKAKSSFAGARRHCRWGVHHPRFGERARQCALP